MTDTIAVLSQKGGTGKTTTVRTLTDAFRRSGVKPLAVGLSPQGNLSDYFDLPTDAEPTIADVLSGRSALDEAILSDIVPANLSLAEAELMLGGKMGRELTLRRALAKAGADYDLWSKGVIEAIDYQTGKIRWTHEMGTGTPTAGILTTGSGLLFTGDLKGNVLVLETSTGKTLWHAGLGARISTSPISYELAGRQYVLLSAGTVLFAWALPQGHM